MVNHRRQRKNITLGKITKRDADLFAAQVGRLVSHDKHGSGALPADLRSWLETLPEAQKIQLSELGLFTYKSNRITVGQLLDEYLAAYELRTDVEPSTKTKVRSTIRNRMSRIRQKKISELEPKQHSIRINAEPTWSIESRAALRHFNSWQRNYFATATWTRDNKLLSSVGIWAVKHGYCDFNPFSELPTGSMVNDERNEYIEVESVLDAMDSSLHPDIRLTLAMGRFCGLRTCSEVRTMKWEHVDFDAGQLTIIDSKKKIPKQMPLFDRPRQELEKQFELTGSTRWVCSPDLRNSSSAANFQKIKDAVRRSGQEPWERLRQNLRTSCENDLLEVFPERMVAQWLGHTVAVSRKHYQKLRSQDYEKAIERVRDAGLL